MAFRAYRVEITERAARDLIYLYDRINADQSTAAVRWFNRLELAVQSLSKLPKRCPMIPEDRSLRCLLYGRKPNVYRIIFGISDHKRIVRIITIRHGAMDCIRDLDSY